MPTEAAAEHDQSLRLPTIVEESLSTNDMAPMGETPLDNVLPGDISVPEIPHLQDPMSVPPPAYPETPQPFGDLQAQPMSDVAPFGDLSQQPLDNMLQPMSVPPPLPSDQDDIAKTPGSAEVS